MGPGAEPQRSVLTQPVQEVKGGPVLQERKLSLRKFSDLSKATRLGVLLGPELSPLLPSPSSIPFISNTAIRQLSIIAVVPITDH